MSQEKLGEQLGLTFQQVQKYESGSNRVSASRLFQIAQILGVPVQFFFEGVPATTEPPGSSSNAAGTADQSMIMGFLNSSEGIQLNRAFSEISDGTVRRRIVELVVSLAEGNARN